MPTPVADVPAALSALSISPLAHCARFGRMAATTATACRRGTAWKACAPISNPMYSRIGTIAGTGSSASSTPKSPRKQKIPITTPLANE